MNLPSFALLFVIGVLCSASGGYAKEPLDSREDRMDISSAGVLEDELNNGSLRARGLKKKEWSYKGGKSDNMTSSSSKGECGVDYCEAKQISLGGMKTCLKEHFDHLSNLYFPEDGDDYHLASHTASCISRYPAAIVYVENVEEVQHALKCAVDNGYKVSPRGGNHSFQGLGTMDGYVVIDMGRTCKPDEFVVDKTDQGPHILKGSKYIGTIKAQAGCTNAIMLAAGHKHFSQDGGITLIGGCPSVGITGFILGGGGGDISPYVGYGVDIVKEFQLVLYDGTVVKASEDENADLYWASRGGGGGNGIVTHLTYKIVQAPKQKYEEDKGRKFTLLYFAMGIKNIDKAAKRIMEWFYDADPLITGKFGGGFGWFKIPTGNSALFNFVYLGSWREAVEDLKTTGLLDDEIFSVAPPFAFPGFGTTVLSEDHEVICTSGEPCPLLEGSLSNAYEFNSFAEVEIAGICQNLHQSPGVNDLTSSTGDMCKDLEIDNDECQDYLTSDRVPLRVIKLCNKVVIDAMLKKAGDPTSFMNSHGPSPEFIDLSLRNIPGAENATVSDYIEYISRNSVSGSAMWPRLDDKLFAKILKDYPERLDHLQHAAALKVDPDATAFPWRDSAFMLQYNSDEEAKTFLELLVKEGVPAQGYYAYLNPPGMKKWRSYFFDDKWKELSKIRAKYDPKDVFGKPLTIESLGE